MLTNQRLHEMKEVAELASLENRHDIVESIYIELKDAGYNSFNEAIESSIKDSQVIVMSNEYIEYTPQDQILSNQINNLISYFGRDKVKDMANLILNSERMS
jgi:hypothetical protein